MVVWVDDVGWREVVVGYEILHLRQGYIPLVGGRIKNKHQRIKNCPYGMMMWGI